MDIEELIKNINEFLDQFRKAKPWSSNGKLFEIEKLMIDLQKIREEKEKEGKSLWLSIIVKEGEKTESCIGRCKKLSLDKERRTVTFILENDRLVNSHLELVTVEKNVPLKNIDYLIHWPVPDELERKLKLLRKKGPKI